MENNGLENNLIPQNPENVAEKKESALEGEINQELETLQANTIALHSEIEAAGLSEEKEDMLSSYDFHNDDYKKKWSAIKAGLAILPTAFIVYMDAKVLPELNLHIPSNKTMGEYMAYGTVAGLALTALYISNYIKYKKRTDQFEEFSQQAL